MLFRSVVHATRWAPGYLNTLRLRAYGDRGGLEIQHGMNGSSLQICVGDDVEIAQWQDVPVEPVPTNYHRFAEAVMSGVNGDPGFRYAAELQKILDLGFVSDQQRKEIAVG